MDMQAKQPDQLIFHLTGQRSGSAPAAVDGLALRPALLAPYRDLGALRHDFPVVLVDAPPPVLRTLSGAVDEVLRDMAPRGIEGERLRRHALQLEREIRRVVDDGAAGTLGDSWQAASARLGADGGEQGQTLAQVLGHAGNALRFDGELLRCDAAMPARLLTRAWQAAQAAKAQRFQADLARLVLGLSDILRAAFSHSQAGRQPQSLQASLGGPHQAQFDFDALSRIVGKGAPRDELPSARRARIEQTLAALQQQRFFAPAGDGQPAVGTDGFDFVFDNCAAAAQAYGQRLGEAVGLIKALAIAELETADRYLEAEHDLFFAAFGEGALTADDLARLPDYLVCIPPDRNEAPENANLMEMLSSGLPVKVLVQTADLLQEAAIGTGRFAFGVRSARLATAAMGLGGMFVLQSVSANLVAAAPQIERGMVCRGPALFSVYAPDAAPTGALPSYLAAAAAMQSRAFPAFCYDAAAGANWAERFSLLNNPQPDADWPVETLVYADAAQQRVEQPCAFTFADFALCDPRHAAHFALVPRAQWSEAMLPAADWLALPEGEAEAARRVPYLLAVDAGDVLQRVIVDARLMQAARRCLLLWRRLQEHGGVHDSHADRLLAREKAAWSTARQPTPEAAAEAAPAARAEAETPATQAVAEPAHSREEAWIDSARCPSCNECQLINDRMFAYDERKQAYIKDITAGSYRQLVEAAESCQVAIIHPGAPRDPNEPGLEELLARAEPFR